MSDFVFLHNQTGGVRECVSARSRATRGSSATIRIRCVGYLRYVGEYAVCEVYTVAPVLVTTGICNERRYIRYIKYIQAFPPIALPPQQAQVQNERTGKSAQHRKQGGESTGCGINASQQSSRIVIMRRIPPPYTVFSCINTREA